ncbi:MAG: hypothetical protein QOI36_357 [Pseudonocardiales bacterium]|jgi:hypothetical protein|nr:excalibur calcium-binding protein [Pseudonocardia sp.]MDT7648951.1 hypothetical protein [Pseudonocardiales bacterium]
MNLPRRTRAAAFAAALSAALVVGMTGTALAFDDLNCNDFTYQEDALAVLDGVTCESLPHRPAGTALATEDKTEDEPQTTPQAAPAELGSNAGRDCPDFATRADAQAALDSRGGDSERLDADDDGVACEQHFGTDGREAAVFPVGGVVTGGTPAP